ncbi:TIR-like protein FxsC [Streptomyces tailanensis]|uniref:TIR-like protein FxsC n=1 Tax=Streptomyces tailanensis TaxID=2569858 RepID=UPI00122E0A3E|nr:TIR-like protein FxsC [Streptomyces tailanensis]
MPFVRRGMVGGTSNQPYFFLSYARRDDRATYVGRFYNDLLQALAPPVKGSARQPAFHDVENIMEGDDWPIELSRAVGSCRAIVALYSPAYFRSEYCGREWTHFAARVERYRQLTFVQPRALVPVIWEPVSQREMPAEVRAIQYGEAGLGEEYLRHGLLQLMRSDPGGPAYRHVVAELAERVRRAADPFNLPVDKPPAFDLSKVQGCFPPRRRTGTHRPRPDLRRGLHRVEAPGGAFTHHVLRGSPVVVGTVQPAARPDRGGASQAGPQR